MKSNLATALFGLKMKTRKSKLLKVVIFIILFLIVKWAFSTMCKFTCKLLKEDKPTYIDALPSKTEPSEFHVTTERSFIDENISWASYQRNIIIKQAEEKRKLFAENRTATDLTDSRVIKNQSQTFEGFVAKYKEESNEYDMVIGVEENEAKSRESNEGEVSSKSFGIATKKAIENAIHQTTAYEKAEQLFANKQEELKRQEEGSGKEDEGKVKYGEEKSEFEERQREEGTEERQGGDDKYENIKYEEESENQETTNTKFQDDEKMIAPSTKSNASSKQHRQLEIGRKAMFPAKKKLVLLYTPLFGRMPWPRLENSDDFTQFRGKPCAVRNCEITYNKSRILESDAVVFHCNDLPSAEEMKKLSRHERQRWVFFTHENPVFTYQNLTHYNHFFNWTMTYRSDSDFFVPYNYFTRLESDEEIQKRKNQRKHYRAKHKKISAINYAKGKDKLAAWMVGNCGQLRDKIVSKLTKYLNITIFGACASKFNQSGNHCMRGSRDCNHLLRRFKFYLSFENQMCLDYVTEKYWYTPFEHDMVPIVLGSNYDSHIAIPGSFINVLDFPSIKALARYLQYLDRNDTAYNEYFMWKTKYRIDYPLSVVWPCNMCAALNNASMPNKIYHNLDSFWGVNTTCEQNTDKINALLKDSHDSATSKIYSED